MSSEEKCLRPVSLAKGSTAIHPLIASSVMRCRSSADCDILLTIRLDNHVYCGKRATLLLNLFTVSCTMLLSLSVESQFRCGVFTLPARENILSDATLVAWIGKTMRARCGQLTALTFQNASES